MPRITDIKEQKRKGRFNVYVDGEFAFGLSAEALVKTGLVVDQEISEGNIKRLRDKDAKSKLYNQSLRFLSYRPRSEKEVREYLLKKISLKKIKVRQLADQRQSALIESIVSKLKSQDLIDDTKFTEWWIEQRQSFKPKGVYVLRQELRRKGISNSLISQLLNNSITPETEQKTAKRLAGKKREQLKGLSYSELKQKLTQFLAYRGFSYQTIKLVLDEILKKK